MFNDRMSTPVLVKVLNSLVNSGALSGAAVRDLVTNMVNGIFDECGVSPEKFINCIKAVRNCTGWGLKEAKDFTDQHRRMTTPRVNVTALINDLADYKRNDRFWIETYEGRDALERSIQSTAHVDVDMLRQDVIDQIVGEWDIPF